MRIVPIQMKQWLRMNKRSQVLPSDLWYLNFAIRLLPIIKASGLFITDKEQVGAALSLCLYFQDAIAQKGGWKSVSHWFLSVGNPKEPGNRSAKKAAYLLYTVWYP